VRDAESAILSPFTSRRSEVCAHVALVGYTVAMPDVLAALRARLHPHRIDPDLSAFVAFPACGCGTLLWPNGPADARPERLVGAQSRRRARTAR
jgi:hypothetical protein